MASRGTGAVEVNGAVIYALYAVEAEELRLRISLDEWELLGVHHGEWVVVRPPGRRPERVLLTASCERPPWVWLGFERESGPRVGDQGVRAYAAGELVRVASLRDGTA